MTLAVMVLVMDTEWTHTYMGAPKMSPVNAERPSLSSKMNAMNPQSINVCRHVSECLWSIKQSRRRMSPLGRVYVRLVMVVIYSFHIPHCSYTCPLLMLWQVVAYEDIGNILTLLICFPLLRRRHGTDFKLRRYGKLHTDVPSERSSLLTK